MEAAMQQAQDMRQARATGLRPGEKPMDTGRPNPEGEGGDPSQRIPEINPGEIGELPELKSLKKKSDWADLPEKVAKKLLENNREDMSPAFRDAIIKYLTELAKRSRKKNPSPQKKK